MQQHSKHFQVLSLRNFVLFSACFFREEHVFYREQQFVFASLYLGGNAMFTVTKYPQGTFSWVDYAAHDQNAAKSFYGELLGWTSKDSPIGDSGMDYTNFYKDGHRVAGAGPTQGSEPTVWTSYINVEDADAIIGKVADLGGTVVMPPMDIMDEGRMAMLQDPTGAYVGLWQPKNHSGAGLVNTEGAFCWNELATRDVEKAKDFFGKLLGWTFESSGDNYTMIKNKGRSNGGIIQMSEEWGDTPPNWTVYFTVADVEVAAAKAESLGGKLVMPIGSGDGMRWAIISDPQGGVFTLIQSERIDPWEE
jgi:predicted enzyme related to lactoylglutathione lyase